MLCYMVYIVYNQNARLCIDSICAYYIQLYVTFRKMACKAWQHGMSSLTCINLEPGHPVDDEAVQCPLDCNVDDLNTSLQPCTLCLLLESSDETCRVVLSGQKLVMASCLISPCLCNSVVLQLKVTTCPHYGQLWPHPKQNTILACNLHKARHVI